MTTDGTVGGLQQTIHLATDEIGKVQSALGLARDRSQQARDILLRGTEGSTRDETASARAALEAVDEVIEQAIEATVIAVEQLGTYSGTL